MLRGGGAATRRRYPTKRRIKIRNEKRTKRTYQTCIVEPSRVCSANKIETIGNASLE